MRRAVIALGSNLGCREDNLEQALSALGALPETAVTAVSSLYETDPVGYADQPRFFNMAAVVETALSPRALLGACLGIEAALGRVRSFPNAPRTLDLDLLVMEGEEVSVPELRLPHPRMEERGFVLAPLRDLFPDGMVLDRDLSGAMRTASYSGVFRVENPVVQKKFEKFQKTT
ncbi:MAG TPA: 2-amino-4-hydroxy-6-hydroxymethyldihydropteridine diphosphokinase [Firmicutes bacterium]|nr:2-amino-4-hydroxy-6-hydroxymethyldihydropteridine diphosphokinase [Bacillota bacterium]